MWAPYQAVAAVTHDDLRIDVILASTNPALLS